jgi:hypothetical protein
MPGSRRRRVSIIPKGTCTRERTRERLTTHDSKVRTSVCISYVGTSYEIETAPGEMAVKGQAWLVESDGFPLP